MDWAESCLHEQDREVTRERLQKLHGVSELEQVIAIAAQGPCATFKWNSEVWEQSISCMPVLLCGSNLAQPVPVAA